MRKKTITKRLNEYKKKSGKSNDKMGREMNVSSYTVFRWVRGYRVPKNLYYDTLDGYLKERGH